MLILKGVCHHGKTCNSIRSIFQGRLWALQEWKLWFWLSLKHRCLLPHSLYDFVWFQHFWQFVCAGGCRMQGRRTEVLGQREVTCNFCLPCWDSQKPLSWRKVNCCCDRGSVHKGSSCSRVRWETTADTADEINFLCCLIINGTSLSLSVSYQSFFMHCGFEGKQQVASWECLPKHGGNTLKTCANENPVPLNMRKGADETLKIRKLFKVNTTKEGTKWTQREGLHFESIC